VWTGLNWLRIWRDSLNIVINKLSSFVVSGSPIKEADSMHCSVAVSAFVHVISS